ncbi:aspartate/glutamate racemase family protein [Lichenicoccus sp.]|uniref:aspartate/glutamate racemase family protein n=1 Tax=Lichenicoccus sp. TaxID=2781899 RepID=UPI003D0CBCFD
MPKIGLIGGLAFRAGIFYYEQLMQRYRARGEPLELILAHADISRVLSFVNARDAAGLGDYLGSLANALSDAGCGIVAVTAVAPHFAIAELSRIARVPIANVLEAIAAKLCASGLHGRVAVFGNRAVVQTNVFGAVPEAMAMPMDASTLEFVHETYNRIALEGKRGTQPETDALSRVAHGLLDDHGAQTILLAGTDLSSFYAKTPPDFPFLDVARLHIDQIVRLAAG